MTGAEAANSEAKSRAEAADLYTPRQDSGKHQARAYSIGAFQGFS
jgi:hypothetical protein